MSVSQLFDSISYEGDTASLELSPDWLQGRTAYGGWQAALGLRAMERVRGDAVPLRSLQVNFIAPVPPGR
ncbi:MAG: thioesterase family protein [Rhodocyclaceae bacterium]|nr:thioesterase family protein [Rhodocyclaceae bacterium]